MIHEFTRNHTNQTTRKIPVGSCDFVDRVSLGSRVKASGHALNSLTSLAVLLILTISASSALGQRRDLVQRLEQVAALIRDNRINEAEKSLASILRTTPNSPGALNLKGTIRAKQGRMNEAEALFLRALRTDGKFTAARMNLAYLYLFKRSPKKSILQYREILRLEPANVDVAQKLAELLLAEGAVDECIRLIEKFREAQTLPADLLVMLGDAHLTKRDLTKAEENYLLALDGKLDNAGALLGLAQISQAKSETREAFIYLTRVASLAADSESPDFLYRFALIAMKAEMSDQAKSALERALKLRPNETAYVLLLGVAWLRKGDLFESEKIFRRLLELQPNSTQGQLHLGYVLLNQKKYGEAREWLEKSARSETPVPEVYYYLGLVAQEQNDDAGAIALFEKAVQKLPAYVHARIALGSSYMKLRNYPRAQHELETAVKLDPNEPTAHYNLALLYARLKDPKRAQEEMRIVEKLKSKGSADGGVVVLPPPSPRR